MKYTIHERNSEDSIIIEGCDKAEIETKAEVKCPKLGWVEWWGEPTPETIGERMARLNKRFDEIKERG